MNKYYIKQFVINNYTFQQWEDKFSKEVNNSSIIGYLFYSRPNKFGEDSLLLNLYLINNSQYKGNTISREIINRDWEVFFNNPKSRVWKNPPIDIWLNTKNNWCKKIATKFSEQFNTSFEEILSDVYYSVIICYNKPNVYMGSLNYISKVIYNTILMNIRSNKHINDISLNTVISMDKDDNEITLEDLQIDENDDCGQSDLEFRDTYNKTIKALKLTFSNREIEQIVNNNPLYLDRNIYSRLLKWRMKHTSKEILNNEL